MRHGGRREVRRAALSPWLAGGLLIVVFAVGAGVAYTRQPELKPCESTGSPASLDGCPLRDPDLVGVDLKGALLRGAQLEGVNLSSRDLRGAHFEGASLAGVNFTNAQLQGAFFNGADLTGAVLRGACTRGAHFEASNLSRADLAGADLQYAGLPTAVTAPTPTSSTSC